eukprot:4786498-Pleurochrysis_carterae.AAC.1
MPAHAQARVCRVCASHSYMFISRAHSARTLAHEHARAFVDVARAFVHGRARAVLSRPPCN